jgi:NAD(P)-dependent dehydrogenase (short-subunit alcohol dehydrogenase family)
MAIQRVAIVTGGNRGIGFEICRQLVHAGLKVVLTARDETKAHEACAKLARGGEDVLHHQLDVADDWSIGRLTSYVEAELGRWDVLINNAGVYLDGSTSSANLDPAIFRRTLDTNLTGAFVLSQAALPLMNKHRYGRIVNISSSMGDHQSGLVQGGYLAYRVSKAALNAMTRVMAADLRGTNILINVMSPGWVRTDMGGASAPRSVKEGADTAAWLAQLPDGGPSGEYFFDRKQIAW